MFCGAAYSCGMGEVGPGECEEYPDPAERGGVSVAAEVNRGKEGGNGLVSNSFNITS